MTIEVECISCECTFELRISSLMRDGTRLKCPECGETSDEATLEAFQENLQGLVEAVAEIRDVFRFNLSLDTEELPAPYGVRSGEDDVVEADDEDFHYEPEEEELDNE